MARGSGICTAAPLALPASTGTLVLGGSAAGGALKPAGRAPQGASVLLLGGSGAAPPAKGGVVLEVGEQAAAPPVTGHHGVIWVVPAGGARGRWRGGVG